MVGKKRTLERWVETTKKALESPDGVHVWSIMTAMRGPDFENNVPLQYNVLKSRTTAILRTAIFGDMTERCLAEFAFQREVPEFSISDSRKLENLIRTNLSMYGFGVSSHFKRHVIDCASSYESLMVSRNIPKRGVKVEDKKT